MTVNLKATTLVKPGDPSDVYQIGKPRFRRPVAGGGVGLTMPIPADASAGDDVTSWHSVLWSIYTDPDDAAIVGSSVWVAVWRYYDSMSPAVFSGGVGSVATYVARGQWVQGEHLRLALNGASTGVLNAWPEFTAVPTYNSDRMYFQIRATTMPLGDIAWIGHALYGVTPRTPDGSVPSILAAVASSAAGGGTDDTLVTTLRATGVGAINAVTAALGVDEELIGVSVAFKLPPAPGGALTAPVTAGVLRIYLDSATSVAYDVDLFNCDPSLLLGGSHSIWWDPKTRLNFDAGDVIRVTYANPDARV
jgi:hypothetical protein